MTERNFAFVKPDEAGVKEVREIGNVKRLTFTATYVDDTTVHAAMIATSKSSDISVTMYEADYDSIMEAATVFGNHMIQARIEAIMHDPQLLREALEALGIGMVELTRDELDDLLPSGTPAGTPEDPIKA